MTAKTPRFVVHTTTSFYKVRDPYRVVDTTTNATIDEYGSKRAAIMHARFLNQQERQTTTMTDQTKPTTTPTIEDQLQALRLAGYKPYARMRIDGRDLELISFPFPRDDGRTIGCMVRVPDDPTTMTEWIVADHVIAAALQYFGPTTPTDDVEGMVF
jgi:hypothetical protein